MPLLSPLAHHFLSCFQSCAEIPVELEEVHTAKKPKTAEEQELAVAPATQEPPTSQMAPELPADILTIAAAPLVGVDGADLSAAAAPTPANTPIAPEASPAATDQAAAEAEAIPTFVEDVFADILT